VSASHFEGLIKTLGLVPTEERRGEAAGGGLDESASLSGPRSAEGSRRVRRVARFDRTYKLVIATEYENAPNRTKVPSSVGRPVFVSRGCVDACRAARGRRKG
jgi:hypothetical protein